MTILKKYIDIKDFLQRFTIFKIGKLHVRIHTIKSSDQTTLLHNHPFHYLSFILKGGYQETVVKSGGEKQIKTHKRFSTIFRSKNTFHRIDKLINDSESVTLFFAYGNYGWKAINMNHNENDIDGIYERKVKDKIIWSKREKGIWFIGNVDKEMARRETRHNIHQV